MDNQKTLQDKKIGIVSCYFQHNYGSMLQAYATQLILDQLNYDCETIDITGFNKEIRQAKAKYFIKASLTSNILMYKFGRAKSMLMKKVLNSEYSHFSKQRDQLFDVFSRKYFRMSERFSTKAELGKNCEARYSAIIVGSDQLWLPANIAADYYTLGFVPDTVNSIAYATSFGQSSLPPDSSKKAALFLKKIRHISVREESGQLLVKKLSGRNVPVVCDPTLLFTGEEWMDIQQEDALEKEPYILCYFLGRNPIHRNFARKLKQETNCKIIALPHLDEYVRADENYADEKRYDIAPSDFLNLVRNAEYVCTDSFHCTVFSILYQRNFFVFRRYPQKTRHSTNSRIDSLFHVLGISDRLLSGEEAISDCLHLAINYQEVHKRIDVLRKKSLEYLLNSLRDEKATDL